MPKKLDDNPTAIGGVITRRRALGGMMTAVLTPVLISAHANAAEAAPTPKQRVAPPLINEGVTVGDVTPLPRAMHTATMLPDGRIVMVGGLSANNRALSSVQIYDPSSDTWENGPPLQTARFQHAATALADGRILVTGGIKNTNTPLSSGEIYAAGANTWTPAPAMNIARSNHTLTALGNGNVIVMGGVHSNPLSSVEVYIVLAE